MKAMNMRAGMSRAAMARTGTWLAATGLAFTALTASAAQSDGAEAVTYEEAMACSSLYTILASAVDDTADYGSFVETAARWLVIATNREGRDDIIPEEVLQEQVGALLTVLEREADEEAREALLYAQIDACDAKYDLIASEFDSININ